MRTVYSTNTNATILGRVKHASPPLGLALVALRVVKSFFILLLGSNATLFAKAPHPV